MLNLGCKCEGYIPKAKSTQTFICPANRQVYTLNKRNKELCEKLMNKAGNGVSLIESNVSYRYYKIIILLLEVVGIKILFTNEN